MEKPEKKRSLFAELMEAVDDIDQWREGNIILKTYNVESNNEKKAWHDHSRKI